MANNVGDVFSDSQPLDAPETVEFSLLEASKENVQPLATGRRVTALSTLLATPHAQRESRLSATKKRLRMNVEVALEDEDDNPLEAYSHLVHWTMENYPQGQCVESGLIELLEEATRVLKDHRDGIWRGEMKYLKLWLLYTGYVERPTIIYQFLLANEIGTNHAVLYEEYAAVLERDGRRKAADDIYVLGINRRAQPLDHLRQRHKEFQIRMMLLPPVESAEEAQATSPATNAGPSKQSRRPVLAQSQRSTTVAPPSQAPRSNREQPQSNRRFDVFMDPTEEDAATSTNAYPEIGTRIERVKENRPEKKPMAGSTIKQKGKVRRAAMAAVPSKIVPYEDPGTEVDGDEASGSSNQSSGFTVFQDDEEENGDSHLPPPATINDPDVPGTPRAPVLVVRAGSGIDSTEAEALRKDPLKNYDLGNS